MIVISSQKKIKHHKGAIKMNEKSKKETLHAFIIIRKGQTVIHLVNIHIYIQFTRVDESQNSK